MERIVYRIPLDATKSGIQGTLQGFMTGDILSRRIEITLSSRGESVVLTENEAAAMYVHKAGAVEPSINACTIEDGKAIYDVLQSDVDTVGITKMQLKIVSGERVLMSPYFAIEVTDSMTGDTQAVTTPTYSALEQALAQAQTVYNERIVSVSLSEDLLFRVDYADGNFYESTAIADKIGNIDVAEADRVRAEELRISAEEERAFAERNRVSLFTAMQSSVQNALDTTEALQESLVGLVEAQGVTAEEKEAWNKKADGIKYVGATLSLLSGDETIATTTIIGGEGGSVVLPDNVLVASDVSAAEVNPPKINADLFGSLTPADYAKTTDVNVIINGTTQVGNAKTLDGHGVEYFAPLSLLNAKAMPIGTDLNDCRELGTYYFDSYATNYVNTPSDTAHNGIMVVRKQSNMRLVQEYVSINTGIMYIRTAGNVSTWNDWKTLATTADLANYLPLDGSGVLKDLSFKNGNQGFGRIYKNNSDTADYGTHLEDHTVNGKKAFIRVNASTDVVDFVKTNNINYPLLHTGNKPTGTYTGTGETKTINTGGIGDCAIVWRDDGLFSILTYGGVINGGNDGAVSTGTGANCKNGNITVAGSDKHYNEVGVAYKYRLL